MGKVPPLIPVQQSRAVFSLPESEKRETFSLQAMDHRGSVSPNLLDPRCSMSENPTCGDDELDEETVNFITALYEALGPLLPEVTKLQNPQDPPAHLMVDMRTKLREMGSSVSDARKKMLKYNIYLKRRLARAVQEKKAWREQQQRQQECNEQLSPVPVALPRGFRLEMEPGKSNMGPEKNIQEIPSPELVRTKMPERGHRRGVSLQDPHFVPMPLQEIVDEHGRVCIAPQGLLQKSGCRLDNMPSRPSLDRGQM
ncbi:uncharacterized protein LOC133378185 isoform X2 [Rhineura floridana]|uniref:uncharacterized protein LOC133378185 isoform X2 n=2 Tax=Rhineura floridana TaxID=261503 RepID=UPI002AC80F69|nr:uncharacterized protein LOC133378185 isoform X2 [Rhineura floridana]